MAFPRCGEFPARVRQGLDNDHQQCAKSSDGGGFLHRPLLTGGDDNGGTWPGGTCGIDGSFVTQLGHGILDLSYRRAIETAALRMIDDIY